MRCSWWIVEDLIVFAIIFIAALLLAKVSIGHPRSFEAFALRSPIVPNPHSPIVSSSARRGDSPPLRVGFFDSTDSAAHTALEQHGEDLDVVAGLWFRLNHVGGVDENTIPNTSVSDVIRLLRQNSNKLVFGTVSIATG